MIKAWFYEECLEFFKQPKKFSTDFVFPLDKIQFIDYILKKAMKREVVIFKAYRELLELRGSSGKFSETRLGAAYGAYIKYK